MNAKSVGQSTDSIARHLPDLRAGSNLVTMEAVAIVEAILESGIERLHLAHAPARDAPSQPTTGAVLIDLYALLAQLGLEGSLGRAPCQISGRRCVMTWIMPPYAGTGSAVVNAAVRH
jgi:hypothetical protein